MANPTAPQCHAAVSYYEKKYFEVYGRAAVVNRHKARWGFDSILRGMSAKECNSLIDYYFETDKSSNQLHSLEWFFFNYDKLMNARNTQEEKADERDKLREESKQRVKEWRERGRQGITNN
jgi:hypothetical protein